MMIKKLRRRFIFMTMLLVSIVLVVTFTVLLYSASNRMESESFRSLEEEHARLYTAETQSNLKNDLENQGSSKRDKPFDGRSHFSYFFVTLGDSDEILKVDDFSRELTVDITEAAVSSALLQSDTEGVIHELNLRYRVYEDESVKVVGFIDISFETEFLQQQLVNYCLIGIGSLMAFFLMSLLLSNMAIKPVEKAWKQQQQFIADASHELKTPITVMLANTSILLDEKKQDQNKDRKWISYIDLEAKRMKKLVEDLLFLARVDSSELNMHYRLSLSDMVSEIALPFEAVVFESGKKLSCEIEEKIETVGDSGQIKQLVSILLDNAVKYAYEKSVITIRLYRESNKAHLSVNSLSDPISSSDLQSIFDRFYRVDKARSRGDNSYGLGLAIAKEIVTSHKGDISVSSTEELGTTFSISLPLA